MSISTKPTGKVPAYLHISKENHQWLLDNASPRGRGTLLDSVIQFYRNNNTNLSERTGKVEALLTEVLRLLQVNLFALEQRSQEK